jgi:hypothetical protein
MSKGLKAVPGTTSPSTLFISCHVYSTSLRLLAYSVYTCRAAAGAAGWVEGGAMQGGASYGEAEAEGCWAGASQGWAEGRAGQRTGRQLVGCLAGASSGSSSGLRHGACTGMQRADVSITGQLTRVSTRKLPGMPFYYPAGSESA